MWNFELQSRVFTVRLEYFSKFSHVYDYFKTKLLGNDVCVCLCLCESLHKALGCDLQVSLIIFAASAVQVSELLIPAGTSVAGRNLRFPIFRYYRCVSGRPRAPGRIRPDPRRNFAPGKKQRRFLRVRKSPLRIGCSRLLLSKCFPITRTRVVRALRA